MLPYYQKKVIEVLISDLGVEGKVVEISHEEVQEVAAKAEPKLSLLFKKMVKNLAVKQELS